MFVIDPLQKESSVETQSNNSNAEKDLNVEGDKSQDTDPLPVQEIKNEEQVEQYEEYQEIEPAIQEQEVEVEGQQTGWF